MELIDFTNCIEEINSYKGSEKKKTLIYNNKRYLVKFPDPLRQKNKDISYINNAFSEYIGSHIFEIIGFKTQKTILGKYEINGKTKIVCACEDFTNKENILYEFENLTNSAMVDKKIDTEISDIIDVIKENKNIISVDNTIENFWEMFVVDCFIGNTDRHNGNWGFIRNIETNEIKFAPIFDCGSCLNPLLDDSDIEKLSKQEIKNLALNSYSCLKENGKKINGLSYIASLENDDCTKALKDVINKIDFETIKIMIDSIDCMSETRKKFYMEILKIRYDMLKEINV